MRQLFSWLRGQDSPYTYEVIPINSGEPEDEDSSLSDRSIRSRQDAFEKRKYSPLLPLHVSSPRSLLQLLASTLSIHQARHVLKTILIFMVPSFLQRYIKFCHHPVGQPKKIPPTAYLNGVRGLAAYVVFCQHFMTYFYGNTPLWGYHARSKTDVWIFQLPFVRLIHSGRFCVTIFYLLSGYVLGYKPLHHIRQGDLEGLGTNLSSAIFRRALRLFLPLIPPLIFAGMCVSIGIYGTAKHPMRGHVVTRSDRSLWSELVRTFKSFDKVLNPFSHGEVYPRTIPALYTIRVEFRGSIMVFTLLLGLAKARGFMRMAALAAIACYGLQHGRWDAFLFLSGCILAEMRYIRMSSTRNSVQLGGASSFVQVLRVLFWIFMLILSLYMGSFPRHGAKSTPGFRTLARSTPRRYTDDNDLASFWCSLGAVLLVTSLENLPCLQKPFNTAFARYMGDISFSLYVFHVPFMLTTGRWITVYLIRRTNNYNFGFFGGGALLTCILIVVADLQWRAIDMNSVRFARWLEVKVFS